MAALTALGRRDGVLVGSAAGLALVAGYAVVAVAATLGGDLGPLLVLALPLVPVVVLAVLAEPRLGPLLVVLAFPVGTTDFPGLPLQVVQVVAIAAAVLVGLRRLAAGVGPLAWTSGMASLVALVAWMLLGTPSALDHQRAFREIILFAVGSLFAATVAASARTARDVRLFLAVIVAMVAVVGFTTPFGASNVRAAYEGAVVQGRATGLFSEPNQLGTFCATGALLGTGLLFAARTRWARIATAFAVVGAVLGLLLSLSRGSWIGFILGIVVLIVKLPEARRLLAVAAVPVVVLGSTFSAFAPTSPQVEVVGQRLRSIAGERNPYDDRPAVWGEARKEVAEDPLTGHGAGSFPLASTRATSKSRTASAEHAHNLLLTLAAENGLPAAGIAVGFAVHLHLRTRRLARRAAPGDRAVLAALAAALVGVAGQGVVDYTLRNSVILVVLFALIGAVFAYERVTTEPRT